MMRYPNLNYRRHNDFIAYVKNTSPRERLKKRDPKDWRLNQEYLYVENHHIVPQSQGGTDDSHNLVLLLPEEHLFVHQLRYRAFGDRNDMLAVRMMINGFNNNSHKRWAHDSLRTTKATKQAYAFLKQNSAQFRKEVGWQTPEGRERISKARKGTMPAKDAKTGEGVGSVLTNHPKILSGEWVHVTKNRNFSDEEKKKRKKLSTGILNGNSCGKDDSYFVMEGVSFYEKFGFIPSFDLMARYCEAVGIFWPKSKLGEFRFKSFSASTAKSRFVQAVENKTGARYDSYYVQRNFSTKGSQQQNPINTFISSVVGQHA